MGLPYNTVADKTELKQRGCEEEAEYTSDNFPEGKRKFLSAGL